MDPQFIHACHSGDLNQVIHLADDVQGKDNIIDAVCFACEHGHVNVSQWLVDHFGLAFEHEFLRIACEKGHLNVVQWLVSHFHLTEEHAGLKKSHGLYYLSCKFGHLDVFQWLMATFPLSNSKDMCLFGECLRRIESREVIVWILTNFPDVEISSKDKKYVEKLRMEPAEKGEIVVVAKRTRTK